MITHRWWGPVCFDHLPVYGESRPGVEGRPSTLWLSNTSKRRFGHANSGKKTPFVNNHLREVSDPQQETSQWFAAGERKHFFTFKLEQYGALKSWHSSFGACTRNWDCIEWIPKSSRIRMKTYQLFNVCSISKLYSHLQQCLVFKSHLDL